MKAIIVEQLQMDMRFTKETYQALRTLQQLVIINGVKQIPKHLYDDKFAVEVIGRMFPECGICGNITSNVGIMPSTQSRISRTIVTDVAKFWPMYSGSPNFPVPDPFDRDNPYLAYDVCELWDVSIYADTRRDLCKFIADFIETEVFETNDIKPFRIVL